MISFEFDDDKSRANFEKHGIDFHSAQRLWLDPEILEIQAKSESEPRYLIIACIDGKHWSAVITYRGTKIRLISVRRSRKKEVELYES
ncbi:MAG: BrnT family toxin [Chromatiales bacterium]|nr:BrnT family toxin [Gammaproteobacteria bacterium]MBW6477195.1 BrnT family toxin [Chromatiales bacterium]